MGMTEMVQAAEVFVRSIAGYEDTAFAYGRKALGLKPKQAAAGVLRRVVVCPPLDRAGTYEAASRPGQTAANTDGSGSGRPVATLQFPWEVHCWACTSTPAPDSASATSPSAELANDMAAIVLANITLVGLRHGAEGGYGAGTFRRGGFANRPTELRYGSVFVFDWTLPIRIEDVGTPGVTATFEVTPRFGVDAVESDGTTGTTEPPFPVPAEA